MGSQPSSIAGRFATALAKTRLPLRWPSVCSMVASVAAAPPRQMGPARIARRIRGGCQGLFKDLTREAEACSHSPIQWAVSLIGEAASSRSVDGGMDLWHYTVSNVMRRLVAATFRRERGNRQPFRLSSHEVCTVRTWMQY